MLHLPLPHDYQALLELTTTGPFITSPPAGVTFAARNARAHVFTLYHDTAAHRGRWHPLWFVVHNRTLIQYVYAFQEDIGAADVVWKEWELPMNTALRARDGIPVALLSSNH